MTDETFSDLSLPAKMLYGILLDRMGLSMKNGWLDSENRVYIIYQVTEIQKDLGFSKKKAIEYLGELEKFGLVEKKRRGLGLPSILYVKSFLVSNIQSEKNHIAENGTSRGADLGTSEEKEIHENMINNDDNISKDIVKTNGTKNETSRSADLSTSESVEITEITENRDVQSLKNSKESDDSRLKDSRSVDFGTSRSVDSDTSRSAILTPQEVSVLAPLNNNTKYNNIKYNKSNLIVSERNTDKLDRFETDRIGEAVLYENIIKENISYDNLLMIHPEECDIINGILSLILETVLSKSETMIIASNHYPMSLVRSTFLKLNYFHIEYVMECLNNSTSKIKNIKKYLLAALFNAPATMDSYYRAEVNHNMPYLVKAR